MEIVPSIELGFQYHTNIFRSEVVSTPAGSLGLTPAVSAALGGDDHEFGANAAWLLQKYLFVGEGETGETPVSSLDRWNQFQIGANADLFKRNTIGLRLTESMALRNWVVDAEGAVVPYTSQYRNSFGAGLRTNPGPALELVPGFDWVYDHYQAPDFTEEDIPNERALNSRNSFGPKLDAKWAFLPRTALVGHLTWTANQWTQNTVEAGAGTGGEVGSQLDLPNSNFVKFTAGIDGRFTEKVSLQVLAGYGFGIFNLNSVDSPEELGTIDANVSGVDGLLFKTQIKYRLTPKTDSSPGSALTAGYIKDFRSSFFTNYVALNQVFAEFKGSFDDFEPSLRYELRFEGYDGEVVRNDIVNRIVGGVGWHPAKYATLGAGVSWQQRGSSEDTVEYDDVGLNLSAKFAY